MGDRRIFFRGVQNFFIEQYTIYMLNIVNVKVLWDLKESLNYII